MSRAALLSCAAAALGLAFCATALAGGAISLTDPVSSTAVHAVRWGLLVGLGFEIGVGLLLIAMGAPLLKLVVGKDKRVSTSKTIAVGWTLIVAAALLALVYADLLNHPQGLNATNAAGVVGQYALLFGGPLGAAILSKAIVTGQASKDPTAKPAAKSTPSPADLVLNDAGDTDLGDLQYVLFNLVALIFVLGTLLNHPENGLPHIPDVLLGLTSVSAAGYVGKKLLPSELVQSASLDPPEAAPNELVTLKLTGIAQTDKDEIGIWLRFGADDTGQALSARVSGRDATVKFPITPPGHVPTKPVDVTVVTPEGSVLSAGKFTYQAASAHG